MCTVTFLPTRSGYILTSNRDETPARSSTPISKRRIGHVEVRFPKDPLAGGTWFASDGSAFNLVLLNGGFVKHKHMPPYRLSRGIVLLDFYKYRNVQDYIESYDFKGIEPFTMLVIETNDSTHVHELVWDEKQLHHRQYNQNEPAIWSSATLYPEEVRAERESWFEKWLSSSKTKDQHHIVDFHRSGGKGDAWNDFVMDRNGLVQTISITSVEVHEGIFRDILHEELSREAQ